MAASFSRLYIVISIINTIVSRVCISQANCLTIDSRSRSSKLPKHFRLSNKWRLRLISPCQDSLCILRMTTSGTGFQRQQRLPVLCGQGQTENFLITGVGGQMLKCEFCCTGRHFVGSHSTMQASVFVKDMEEDIRSCRLFPVLSVLQQQIRPLVKSSRA